MKISAKALTSFGMCTAFSITLAQATPAETVVKTEVRPVISVQTVETRVDADTIYSPIRNEVVTRLPIDTTVVAPVDTLKLQVMNNINSGIATGKITEREAARLYPALDDIALQEAQFKQVGLTDAAVNNLMRKYHMIGLSVDELANNTDTNDFMPSVENRRMALQRQILFNMAAANLTPAEGEQLLTALNNVSDNYATMRATGGTLTADELESLHKDMFKLSQKLGDRVGGMIVKVVPETHFERSEYLKRIQQGMASKTLSPAEGARLLDQYNRLVLLEQTIAADDGLRSADIKQLAAEINNLTFILTRELRDRQVAGQSMKF